MPTIQESVILHKAYLSINKNLRRRSRVDWILKLFSIFSQTFKKMLMSIQGAALSEEFIHGERHINKLRISGQLKHIKKSGRHCGARSKYNDWRF